MPRDIAGNYTLPAGNPVVPNTIIATNWANTTMADIAAALTASLSIDGSVTTAKIADDAVTPPKLAGLDADGLVARISATEFEGRTLTAPAAGITVTNGDGVAGNPTLALANDLAAVEGLAAAGIAARTAADTWTTRTVTGTANKVTVTNGDGVAGNPTLTLPDAVTLVTPTVTGLLDCTGGQIKFPATQNASADANVLDDYEEGTWTAALTFDTPGNLAVTYTRQVATYTKIGRTVSIYLEIVTATFTHTTASGAMRVTGLPFNRSGGFVAFAASLSTLEGCTGLTALTTATSVLDSTGFAFQRDVQDDAAVVQTTEATSGVQKTVRLTAVYHI